jgi:hypothetical protein
MLPTTLFFSVEMGSQTFSQAICTVILSISASCTAGMTGTGHCTHLFIEMWSHKLFVWAGLNFNPPDLSLLRSQGCRHESLVPGFGSTIFIILI